MEGDGVCVDDDLERCGGCGGDGGFAMEVELPGVLRCRGVDGQDPEGRVLRGLPAGSTQRKGPPLVVATIDAKCLTVREEEPDGEIVAGACEQEILSGGNRGGVFDGLDDATWRQGEGLAGARRVLGKGDSCRPKKDRKKMHGA